jgi:hypothetical protein
MNITFVSTRDSEYMRRLTRDDARGFVWFLAFYLTGSLLVSLLCFISGDGRAILAGLIALWLLWLGWRTVGNRWRDHRTRWPAYYLEPTTFTLTDEAIEISSVTASTRLNWSTMTRVVERPYAFLLFVHPVSYRDVPRSGLNGPQDDQVRAFLIARGLLRPTASESRPAPTISSD